MPTKEKTKVSTADFAKIVEATMNESHLYYAAEAVADLVSQGLVEQNPTLRTETGKLATRATKKGIDSMTTQESGNGGGADLFEIESGIPVPAIEGRGRSRVASIYPFDNMNIGDSFFVAKAAKNLASTVSGANKRYSTEIPGQTRTTRKGKVVAATTQERYFVIRKATKNGVEGSRIFRVAPKQK